MGSNTSRDLLDPPSLAQTLTAAATESAIQDFRGTPSSSANVRDAAAVRVALEVCEKTTVLLRAQLTESQSDADDVAPPPPAKRRRVVDAFTMVS